MSVTLTYQNKLKVESKTLKYKHFFKRNSYLTKSRKQNHSTSFLTSLLQHGVNIYGYYRHHSWQPAAIGTFLALVDGIAELVMRGATGMSMFGTYTSATIGDIICFWIYGFASAWILRQSNVKWLSKKLIAVLT